MNPGKGLAGRPYVSQDCKPTQKLHGVIIGAACGTGYGLYQEYSLLVTTGWGTAIGMLYMIYEFFSVPGLYDDWD